MQKSRYFLVLLFSYALLLTHPLRAQLGMGGKPHASAALDVQSTSKAFYPPRLTTTQRNNIADPQPGALVFDTDKGGLYLYDGTSWMVLAFTTPEFQFTNQVNAGNGISDDNFGQSVAISGDYAVIGAKGHKVGDNENQGAAYVFKRSGAGWEYQTELNASDGGGSDFFGYSVAIDGSFIIVGAYGDNVSNTNQGSAYVFERSGTTTITWTEKNKLVATDGLASDDFGRSVAIDGEYAIVGAPGHKVSSNEDQGAGHIYKRNLVQAQTIVWQLQQKLVTGNGAAGDKFGSSVAISGTYAIVGAPNRNANKGSAYIFLRSGTTWPLQAELTNGAAGDNFGHSVDISGPSSTSVGYAIVGAPYRDVVSKGFTISNVGAAYVYQRGAGAVTWPLTATLTASDVAGNDQFGISVSIDGDRAIVGANGDDVGSTNQGAAYLYERSGSTWPIVRKLNGASRADADNGRSVDISGTNFIIGAPGFLTNTGRATFGSVDN